MFAVRGSISAVAAALITAVLAGPAISHMLVIADARQVNAELLSLIKCASARVNG